MNDQKQLQKHTAGLSDGKLHVDQGKPMNAQQKILAAQKAREAQRSTNTTLNIREDESLLVMADDSSSMRELASLRSSYSKMKYLKEALETFANEVDFTRTPVSVISFNSPFNQAPSRRAMRDFTDGLRAQGGTPIHQSLEQMMERGIRRGILISDGDADRPEAALEQARLLREERQVVDCIHIGDSSNGEATLKEIAEITRGMFFKFEDLESFKKSLRMLSPRHRGQLADKTNEEIKLLTGATKVLK